MARHESTVYDALRPALLTVNDVARLLSVSRDTVYKLVNAGDLRAVRVSERLRFRPEDVEHYLERDGAP